MTVTYRDGGASDGAAVDALFRESFAATFGHLYRAEDLAAFFARFTPEAWAAEFDDSEHAFRLAEDADGLLGYCKLGPLTIPGEAQGTARELRQLYLAERAKGRGIAQALMDWAIATARDGGAEELWLTVYVDNHRARRLYERYGFEDRGPYAFMVGEHADEDRLMRLTL